ncbi:MAG: NADP-dependent isocitrate dehydrogenase, partial [Bacteroidota bacterium]
QKVGTKEFAEAVISNLGKLPASFKAVQYAKNTSLNLPTYKRKAAAKKELVGVDLFVHWRGTDANELATLIHKLDSDGASLSMITNRGIKVYPDGFRETFCTDHWRCRFKPAKGSLLSKQNIITLLTQAENLGIDVIKTENLYQFDGVQGYSLGQGQ